MRAHWLLAGLLYVDALFLLFYASGFGISMAEAQIFYTDTSWLGDLVRFSTALVGQDHLGLRLPFVLIHLINLVLLYRVALDLTRKPFDAWLAVLIYALLPGVNSAALLVNPAGVVILVSLLFLWLLPRWRILAFLLLALSSLLHGAFLLLFLAMMIYGFYYRDWPLSGVSALCFGVGFALFGFDAGGRPEGYFADVFGLYGAIFSPLVFLAFIYGLYWFMVRYEKPLPALWFLSMTVFALSILLSLRQHLPLEDFAPFVVIGTPLMVIAFMNSWRIRLPGFRRFHGVAFGVSLASLALLTTLTFFNKTLYLATDRPTSHFAHSHHYPKFLVEQLGQLGLDRVQTPSKALEQQLAFYGIASGGSVVLDLAPPQGVEYGVLEYEVFGRVVARFFLYERLEKERSVTSSSS